MFTRNKAVVGIMTGAVTAGMSLSAMAPMVAYAEETNTQEDLTESQIGYLKARLTAILEKLDNLKAAISDKSISTTNNWLDEYINSYKQKITNHLDTLVIGDRAKTSELIDQEKENSLYALHTNLKNQWEGDTALQTALADDTADDSPTAKYEELSQAFANAKEAFSDVVEKNRDPDSLDFDGLSWTNPMTVTTYTSTFEEDYGMYVNLDLSYKRSAAGSGYIIWEMPQELADNGFTIVTTGMLAPQASIPTVGTGTATSAPDIYVSEDKKTFIMQIPDGVDNDGHANGTFSFALHSDKKKLADGGDLAAFIVAKTENGDFTHVPVPAGKNGDIAKKTASGFTKIANTGTRETKHTFTIKFETGGGTYIADRTVTDGNLDNFRNWAQSLPSPSKTSYRFVGWFTDATCTQVFDPFQAELKDMTLYAKYIQTVQPESAARNNQKSDLVHTGTTETYIATVAAVTVGAGLAVTVLRRRQK